MSRSRIPSGVMVLCAMLLAASACSAAQNGPPQADKVVVRRGQDAVGRQGDIIRLEVSVLGPALKGLLCGEGERLPVPDQEVTFAVIGDDTGDSELVAPTTMLTSGAGIAGCDLKLGGIFGDRYIEARVAGIDGKVRGTVIKVTSGINVFGDKQEGRAGSTLDDALGVRVLDPRGDPVRDVPVFFRIEGSPRGASLSAEHTKTDADGNAWVFLKLPSITGKVYVVAEVSDPSRGYQARGIRFEAMAVHMPLLVTTVIGGLALFIFGMLLMSEGLQRVAGEKMRWILRMFTRNRFIAILVGATVTGLIQSSSACTVMTVGFVNAGLITLRQAIGVVFGANIGTTATGQVISLNLSDLAFPSIAAGLIIMMVVRDQRLKYWGHAIVGFGLLFLGMSLMSGSLKPLRDCPSFVAFFRGFDCTPVGGVMPIKSVLYSVFIGTAMTVMIQSSSATIGLAMALAGSGMIDFYTAFPIVLGDNIGTTITAILASIGTNRAARRTALAHALFNILGTCYMIPLLYVPAWWGDGRPVFLQLINDITRGNVFAQTPENIERHIAMAHSLFNVFNVVLFTPLVGVLESVCTFIIPTSKEEKEELTYLEPHLLNQPPLALDQAVKELGYMAKLSFDSINDSFSTLDSYDSRLEEKLRKKEDKIDRLQADITEYLSKISQHQLTEREAGMLGPLMHAVNDIERIGDHAENILELAQLKNSNRLSFSGPADEDLQRMFATVRDQFISVMQAIEQRDPAAAEKALKLEEAVNQFDRTLHDSHVERIGAGACNTKAGVIFLDLVANLEKVGDHLTNVAERINMVIRLSAKEA